MGQIQGESFLFTQQLAENQQVGTHSTPLTQEQGTFATTRQRRRICRQMIKLIREPISDGVIPNLFVGSWFCCSTCLTHEHFDHPGAHFQKAIHLLLDSVQVHLTSDVSHFVEECAHYNKRWNLLEFRNCKSRKTFYCLITNLKSCHGHDRISFPNLVSECNQWYIRHI